jgi:hypothetical protein
MPKSHVPNPNECCIILFLNSLKRVGGYTKYNNIIKFFSKFQFHEFFSETTHLTLFFQVFLIKLS